MLGRPDNVDAGLLLQSLIDKWETPPKELVGKLPKGGVQLDFLGHAATTRALLEADLGWSWEPVALNDAGEPLIVVRDGTARMWIRLTVCGVTRLGVGTCPATAFDVEKQLVGDAIRNSAMRFGVALSLWAKEDWESHEEPKPKASARGRAVAERELAHPTRTVPGPDHWDPAIAEADDPIFAERQKLRQRVERLNGSQRAFFRDFLTGIGAPHKSSEMSLEQIASANAWLDTEAAA